ncbi:hypothetical protein P20652_0134 [Pseudoalteromonas sp. BSi20652]|uniref:hypothetical protein n=1 Tax=Pseudoalteromonas sp. BSi20652 TaxID=388384 RepID=UPI0002319B62|nr:hypothetical protein [Pseudoalteromonas sp. BSi20652]GAA58283.1 hypothetical protein P20652_0134 [Pseudoalteromonas sp. BSi20652]
MLNEHYSQASSQRYISNLSEIAQVYNLADKISAEHSQPNAFIGNKALSDSAAYAQSKLGLTMWSRYFGLKLKEADPLVVSINPKLLLGSKMVKDAYGLDGGDLKLGANILSGCTE